MNDWNSHLSFSCLYIHTVCTTQIHGSNFPPLSKTALVEGWMFPHSQVLNHVVLNFSSKLKNLGEYWAETSRMKFSREKRKVLHSGKNNQFLDAGDKQNGVPWSLGYIGGDWSFSFGIRRKFLHSSVRGKLNKNFPYIFCWTQDTWLLYHISRIDPHLCKREVVNDLLKSLYRECWIDATVVCISVPNFCHGWFFMQRLPHCRVQSFYLSSG